MIPKFFNTTSIPSVARWAMDKVKPHATDLMNLEGRKVEVYTWIFEGKFAKYPKAFWQQWDSPKTGEQFTCAVSCTAGQYRGQKSNVIISFTQYRATDGMPLPL